MQNIKQSKQYHRIKNNLFLLDIIISVIFLLAFFFSGFSSGIKEKIILLSENFYLINALYILAFGTILYLLKFPFSIYEGYYLEHRYNLSNQKLLDWFLDGIKQLLVSLVVLLITIELIYIVLHKFPDRWWIFAGLIWLFVNLILSRLMPTVIIPLFYKYIPLENQELKKRVSSLFSRCGVYIKDIYVIDMSAKTKKANALVCGLGKNRRVILGDTLIKKFSADEIEAVIAHELGHYKNRDILKIIIWSFLFSFLAFYICDIFLKRSLILFGFNAIDDIAFFPLFALCLLAMSLLMLPAQNTYSRFIEKKADLFSLNLTRDAGSFISMMNKLGEINLADFSPSRAIEILLYNHPPISKRIKLAESFKDV